MKVKIARRVRLFAAPWTVVLGILQARIMECIAFPFPRRSFQPRDRTQGSHTAGRFFTSWTTKLWQTVFSEDSWNSVSYPPCWLTKLLWFFHLLNLGETCDFTEEYSMLERHYSFQPWPLASWVLHTASWNVCSWNPSPEPQFLYCEKHNLMEILCKCFNQQSQRKTGIGGCSGQPLDDCSHQSKTDSSQIYQMITRDFGQPAEMRE